MMSGERRIARDIVVDWLLLVFAATWLLSGIVGLASAASEVVEGLPASQRTGPLFDDVLESAWASPRAREWWGRTPPTRDGGDAMLVLSRQMKWRDWELQAFGMALGVALNRVQMNGTASEVIVPQDLTSLFAAPHSSSGARLNDDNSDADRASLTAWVGAVSRVTVRQSDYNPALDPADISSLAADRLLDQGMPLFSIGEALPGSSGIWVLHVTATSPPQYFLLPRELSPVSKVKH